MINWKDLIFPPINLWSFPKQKVDTMETYDLDLDIIASEGSTGISCVLYYTLTEHFKPIYKEGMVVQPEEFQQVEFQKLIETKTEKDMSWLIDNLPSEFWVQIASEILDNRVSL